MKVDGKDYPIYYGKIKNVCVVTEIPLHFFVTPFSFFQMELEAEALHGP